MARIFYPVPDFYREWLKDNPKLEFHPTASSAAIRDTEVELIFDHAQATYCTEIFMDEWTALTMPAITEDLMLMDVNTQLDEWLNYKLYFVGSDEAMTKFRKRFGLCIDHIRNIHIVHVTIGPTILDDYGYYYIDSDCSGVDVVAIVLQLKACKRLSLLTNNADLECVLVKYVDASYIGESNTRRTFGNKQLMTGNTRENAVWHNAYYIFVYNSNSLCEVKMIDHGFLITEAEKDSELPGIPSCLIDGFDIKESLEQLAQRSETLTYQEWKRTKQFIRKGLYGA
jgi:hypothetical protein